MNTPTTLQILAATKNQKDGQYLKIANLDDMKMLVVCGTARLIKFYIMHPLYEGEDKCKMDFVFQAKRNTFTKRHTEFAIEYANQGKVQSEYMRNL